MQRQDVYKLIDTERNYQDKLWPMHDGQKFNSHYLVTLDQYIEKAKTVWLTAADETSTSQIIAKIAAIAVAALEHVEGTEVLLEKGLR